VDDANADLIGYLFTDDGGRPCEVVRTAQWDNGYVEVDCAGTLTVRSAGLVRRVKAAR
jgi:hypothetical protein